MTLREMAKKLRLAADLLDELLMADRSTSNETPQTAARLLDEVKRKRTLRKPHWTQTAKGKRILAQRSRKARERREANQ